MNEFTDESALLTSLERLRRVDAPDLTPAILLRLDLADAYSTVDTPLGSVHVAYNDRGISTVMLARDAGEFERLFRAQFGRSVFPGEPVESLRLGIVRHLETGESDLRFDLRGVSEFERAVLYKALEIPRGQIRPYSWIAREIGRPKASRAVGTALARNPIPLLIPCHRVVRADGTIGQYGLGGPVNKRLLLEVEGALARSSTG
jgi:O-6-methylguanine DNA methyltransferase